MKLRITQDELLALQLVTDHILFIIQGGFSFNTKDEYFRYLSYVAVLYASWSLPILIQLYQLNPKSLDEESEPRTAKFDPKAVAQMIQELEVRIRKAIGEEWMNPNPQKYREQIVRDLRMGLMHIARPSPSKLKNMPSS